MARTQGHVSTLGENLQVSSGLQQFRNVSEGAKVYRDGPFGPTSKTETVQPSDQPSDKTSAPATKPSNSERQPSEHSPQNKPQKEPRIAPKTIEKEPAKNAESTPLENVTVPLPGALRDRSEQLAKSLKRSRSIRKWRITSNTIIRVALQSFLDTFELPPGESVNSEEELLKLARKQRAE